MEPINNSLSRWSPSSEETWVGVSWIPDCINLRTIDVKSLEDCQMPAGNSGFICQRFLFPSVGEDGAGPWIRPWERALG